MSEFEIVFINWIVLHIAGLIASLLILDLFFPRRHSCLVWIVYFGIRAVLRSYASALIVTDKMTPLMMNIDVAFIIISAVANFVVLYYVWEAEPLKLCTIGLLSDIICGTAMVLGAYIANLVSGNGPDPNMSTFSWINCLIDFAVVVAVTGCMRIVMKPAALWFAGFEFTHRRLVAAAIIMGVSLFSSTNITDNGGFNYSTTMVSFINALMLVPLGIYLIKRIQSQRDRRVLLRQQAAMTSAYILAVDRQSESINAYGELLDAVRRKIDASEKNLKNEQLRTYVTDLRDYAGKLRGGRYSDSFVLDAELGAFAGRFETAGYTVSFGAGSPAAGGSSQSRAVKEQNAAEITWIILNWTLQAAEADAERKSKGARTSSEDKSIRYSIISRGNQTIFSMSASGFRKRHFPERLLRDHISRGDIITQSGGNNMMEIDFMKEDSAWDH